MLTRETLKLPYIETSQLIFRTNQLTGFYIMSTVAFNMLINRLIVIDIAPLTVLFCNGSLFCNCPMFKDIKDSFSKKYLLVWCE